MRQARRQAAKLRLVKINGASAPSNVATRVTCQVQSVEKDTSAEGRHKVTFSCRLFPKWTEILELEREQLYMDWRNARKEELKSKSGRSRKERDHTELAKLYAFDARHEQIDTASQGASRPILVLHGRSMALWWRCLLPRTW